MNDSAIRRKLVYKGLVRPAIHQRAEPGKVIAVRRTDDRPVTQHMLESIIPPETPDTVIWEDGEEDGFGFIHNPDEEMVLSSLRNYGGL